MKDLAIIVQTCDKYAFCWDGFFHFMNKQWDFDIDVPIYFCNEEKDITLPKNYCQIKTGKNSFTKNLKFILESIKEENVFYLLEDFWPIAPMKKNMFEELYAKFKKLNLAALQISNYTTWYKLNKSEEKVLDQNILYFEKDSDWRFNLQARFWKKDILYSCLKEPRISEEKVSSAIVVEMEINEFIKEKDLNFALFHYFWYPISGVAYRGNLTPFGKELHNICCIDKYVKEVFNQPTA